MKYFILFMLIVSRAVAQDDVSQKIDAAIQFAEAGRSDLALQLFSKLLQTSLTPYEKATVLYNTAVLFASQDKFWEGLAALNQIDSAMNDRVQEASPLEAIQIAYNGAICSLGYAKKELVKIAATKKFTQDELESIAEALDSAERFSNTLDTFANNRVLTGIEMTTLPLRTHLDEEIANLSFRLKMYQERLELLHEDKSALLGTLADLLLEQFFSLLDISLAHKEDSIHEYLQIAHRKYEKRILFCLERLFVFLQAPAKKTLSEMHHFWNEELKRLQTELVDAFSHSNLESALSATCELLSLVQILSAEVTKSEIAALLDDRTYVAAEYSFALGDEKLSAFWQNQWKLRQEFAKAYLNQKIQSSSPTHAELVSLLQKRLQSTLSVENTVRDASYWKILVQPENITFPQLAKTLHGVSKIGNTLALEALHDRLQAIGQNEAASVLQKAMDSESPTVRFQDVIVGWYDVEQTAALSFMLKTLSDETDLLQENKNLDSFTARTDYHLTMHLLSIGEVNDEVYQDLSKHGKWFTAKEKKDFDFFMMSLELAWLNETVINQQSNLEAITEKVDFGVDFQKKTLSLLRFSQEPEFAKRLDLLSKMQQNLTHTVVSKLNSLPKKGPKLKEALSLVEGAEKSVPLQTKEVSSMQNVLDLLEKASKILHELQSEAPSEAQTQKSSELTQNENLSMQMQKQALQLSPELSIRLLQEMEKEDRNLETQIVPQAAGAEKPW